MLFTNVGPGTKAFATLVKLANMSSGALIALQIVYIDFSFFEWIESTYPTMP